jgi:hypothetical protein
MMRGLSIDSNKANYADGGLQYMKWEKIMKLLCHLRVRATAISHFKSHLDDDQE